MSVNREKWHLLVKPEDDANREIAIGFLNALEYPQQAKIQVDRPAGGYQKALEFILTAQLERYRHRRVLILIDFDNSVELRNQLVKRFASVSDRVFVLGSCPEAEDVRRELGRHLEECGEAVAKDCLTRKCEVWQLDCLKHNAAVLARLCPEIYRELFK